MIPNSTAADVTSNELLEAQLSAESPASRFRFLPPALATTFLALLASCTAPNQMPPAGYRLTPAQAAAAAIQAPRGPAYSLDHGTAQAAYTPGGKITTLTEANIVANALAESYSDCGRKRTGLTQQGLGMARYDFQRVTEFGSTHGQGEDPQDASGRTISWEYNIAQWLGMREWLNAYVNEHAAIARKEFVSKGNPKQGQHNTGHKYQNNTTHNQTVNHYAGLYGSVAEANRPMPPYANLQPKTFRQHVVQPGETFSGISKLYRMDRRVVWDWNSKNISNPHQIQPGMVVWIPVY